MRVTGVTLITVLSLEQVWRDLFGDDDLDTIFSRWDPLWGKKTGRYKNKNKWRGDVEQLRPNRFGMGWQVAAREGGRERESERASERASERESSFVLIYLVWDGRWLHPRMPLRYVC